ncbi:SMI1/KNR4 family protein [Corynebacterium sp. c8Ua_181]|uniref:SMI1/KNR4 family protein n=1 Tax=Corynebacterium curieae TaxID=2913500 RepID=A0A9X3MB28_9CORY|nr:SMI1/KNR4 family protein [Corynebacterium curieae]MCZ9307499.1 SMI1/KNR4 family protein [Corynebacterium curieae]MDV2424276.1 SMI1/KNR4 family protein [Corynebacterium curieae]
MPHRTIDFEFPGKKCTSLRIRSLEKALGKKLPEEYRELIKRSGAGILSLKNSFLTFPYDGDDSYELSVEQILGNGQTREGDPNDLVDYGRFLADEYEIPDEVLLFGISESGMHEYLAINYGLEEYPHLSVLYCDDEAEGPEGIVKIADSFADFLNLLGPHPDYVDEDEEETQEDKNYVHKRSAQGPLVDKLQRAIQLTPTPGLESHIRRAAEKTTLKVRKISPELFTFLDLVYWALQHDAPLQGIEDVAGNKPDSLDELLTHSFLIEEHKAGFLCSVAPYEIWWNTRVDEGSLVQKGDGFYLNQDVVDKALEESL